MDASVTEKVIGASGRVQLNEDGTARVVLAVPEDATLTAFVWNRYSTDKDELPTVCLGLGNSHQVDFPLDTAEEVARLLLHRVFAYREEHRVVEGIGDQVQAVVDECGGPAECCNEEQPLASVNVNVDFRSQRGY